MEQLKKKQQLQKKIGQGQAEKAVTPNTIDEPIKIEKPPLQIQADLKKTGILRLKVPFKHIPI